MIAPTHLAAAQTGYLAACLMLGHRPNPAEAMTALVVSQLPDFDTPTSYAGRLVPPLAEWIEHQIGHRTLTHSALLAAVVILITWWWLPIGYEAAISAGLVSHALIDMMTKGGVCWFWPSRVRCVLPGNPRYRMEVAGAAELGFLVVIVVLGVAMMPLAQTGKGPSELVRSAIGNLTAARAEFDAGKGDWVYQLEIQGRDNRSYADISGRYPVIGTYQAGFLLSSPSGPVSVCKSGDGCDWYADSARLERAQPQRTTSYDIKRRSISAAVLVEALAPLATAGDVYLLGEAFALGVIPTPPTVVVSGDHVTLNYATPDVIRDWANAGRMLLNVQLTIQIRHAPAITVPALILPDEIETNHDILIERWLTS